MYYVGNPGRKKETIRKIGTFEFNTNAEYNNGHLIVSRRPSLRRKNELSYYRVCPHCKEHSKFAIRKDFPKCIPNHVKGDRSINVMGKLVHSQINFNASERLRPVFSVFRVDNVTKIFRKYS